MLRAFLPEQLKLKSAGAFDDLFQKIDPKATSEADAKRLMRLAVPDRASTPKPDEPQPPNYRPGDLRDMNRLLGTQR